MTLLCYSNFEQSTHEEAHALVGQQINQLIEDLGEDCTVVLEYDDPETDFTYLFSGTTLALTFNGETINVVDFNFESEDEDVLASFGPCELNKAVYWLLTTANHLNTSS